MVERLPWEEQAGLGRIRGKLSPTHIHLAIETYDILKCSSCQARSNGVIKFWTGGLVLWQ